MRKGIHLRTICAVLTATAMLSAARTWAADAMVFVTMDGFSPSSVSINVGDSVDFIVDDDNAPYCIQSTTGAWTPWYLWSYGDGVAITFNEKGDYYYRDIFYGNTGVVHVGTGGGGVTNIPPSVSVTAPADGAVFTEPASFAFSANATDTDNGMWAVEFYVGANLVDTVFSMPFSTQVTNLAAGSYTLTAKAYDSGQGTATASVNITVQAWTPPSIALSLPSVSGGQFNMGVSGLTVGKQAVLQASTSLGPSAAWVALQTNDVTSATTSFSSPVVPGTRFFRVLQFP